MSGAPIAEWVATENGIARTLRGELRGVINGVEVTVASREGGSRQLRICFCDCEILDEELPPAAARHLAELLTS